MSEAFKCPKYVEKAGLCRETGLSGADRHPACPIGATDCNAVTQQQILSVPGLATRWSEEARLNRKSRQNAVG